MFGLKPVIVGSKLMTEVQYNHAREDIVRAIQTELDSKNEVVVVSLINDADSVNSLDGEFVDEDARGGLVVEGDRDSQEGLDHVLMNLRSGDDYTHVDQELCEDQKDEVEEG